MSYRDHDSFDWVTRQYDGFRGRTFESSKLQRLISVKNNAITVYADGFHRIDILSHSAVDYIGLVDMGRVSRVGQNQPGRVEIG
jgi:hypothetical protein